MAKDPSSVLSVGSEPLSAEQRARCERVAARLHADLSRLVLSLPESARGGSGMSRELGVVRNTCQRVSRAVSDESPSLETLMKLPGVQGLDQLLDAMLGHGLESRQVEMARTAVRAFEDVINDYAGSHAKLSSRLRLSGPDDGGFTLASESARRSLFEAAVGVTGRSAQTTISLYAFRGTPGDPGVLQRAVVTGMIRSAVIPGGMPMVISNGDTIDVSGPEDQTLRNLDNTEAKGSTPEALLEEFTTHPLPSVSSRGNPGGLIRVIDPSGLDGPRVVDVVTAARSNHPYTDPKTGAPVLDEVWSISNCPSVTLVFDIYLHQELERVFRPSIDAQQWYPNLSAPGGDRWVLRYPSVPKLELLGRGTSNASTGAYSRHRELTDALFARIGWEPDEFFGLRCEVRYPVWRGGYCMSFKPV